MVSLLRRVHLPARRRNDRLGRSVCDRVFWRERWRTEYRDFRIRDVRLPFSALKIRAMQADT